MSERADAELSIFADAKRAEGNAAFKAGEFARAVKLYTRALDAAEALPAPPTPEKLKPTPLAAVLANRCVAHARLAEAPDRSDADKKASEAAALADAHAAVAAAPNWPKAHYRLGQRHMHRKDFTKAHAAFKQGWHLDTKNEELTEACREALEAMAQVDREGSMRRAAAAGYTAAAAAPAVHEEARANTEGVALPVPQYELEDLLLEDTLVLRVSLPGVTSFDQIELSASSTSVEVAAAGFSALSIELPAPVDETRSKAKFAKKPAELVIRWPRASV